VFDIEAEGIGSSREKKDERTIPLTDIIECRTDRIRFFPSDRVIWLTRSRDGAEPVHWSACLDVTVEVVD